MFLEAEAVADLELEQLQLRQEFYNQLQLVAEVQDQETTLGQEGEMGGHPHLVQSQQQAEEEDLGMVTEAHLVVLEEGLELVEQLAQAI